MKKIFASLILAFLFYATPGFSNTVQTSDIKIIAEVIEKADKDTLVIFGIDDVLMEPNDQILKFQNKPYLEHIEKKFEKNIKKEEVLNLYSRIFVQRVNRPVNAKMICLIDQLQERGIKAIALTNCPTGPFGKIPSLEDWRINELNQLGYDFYKSWKHLKVSSSSYLYKYPIVAHEKKTNFPSLRYSSLQNPERPALYKKGVVFAASLSKGDALNRFLSISRPAFSPKRIIFIDDKLKHLQSVEEIAKQQNIPFTGIEYSAVKEQKLLPLDKKRSEFQFRFLEKEGIWLSDVQARSLM